MVIHDDGGEFCRSCGCPVEWTDHAGWRHVDPPKRPHRIVVPA